MSSQSDKVPASGVALRAARERKLSAKEKREQQQLISSLLKKHNAVIHIEGSLSLLERKLYNVLLLSAFDQLETERTHMIPVWLLCDMLGFDSNNIKHLQAALRTLQSTVLEVNLLKDGRHVWEAMTLLSYAKLEKGICTYRYDEAVASRLHTPEVYTSINLAVQNRFSSAHALALYENCVRFRGIGNTGPWEVSLLKLMMGVHREPSYKAFKEFNRSCLKRAVTEINERSDIIIEPRFEREGREIVRVSFSVEKNPQRDLYMGSIDDPNTRLRQSSAFIKLRAVGLPEHLALMYLTHDAKRVEAALRHLETEENRSSSRIRNRVAYLRALIDSGVDFSRPQEQVRQQAQSLLEETARQRAEAEKDCARFRLRAERMRQAIDALRADEIKRLTQEFCASVGRSIALDPNGQPANKFDRTLFGMWLRSRITIDEPSEDEINAAAQTAASSRSACEQAAG